MYNRYIGNTGKFYRVEDVDDLRPAAPVVPLIEPDRRTESVPPERGWEQMPPPPTWNPPPSPPPDSRPPDQDKRRETPPLPPLAEEKAKFDMGAIWNMPGNLRGSLQNKLPERIDLGDILLVLVLLYLFLEGEEDEMLIVLGILIVMWIWPLFGKEE